MSDIDQIMEDQKKIQKLINDVNAHMFSLSRKLPPKKRSDADEILVAFAFAVHDALLAIYVQDKQIINVLKEHVLNKKN